MSIKVAMMQPTFLPWLGYFELISKADKFIFLDDFQFIYRSFHRRNRIFASKNVVKMITVPIDEKSNYQYPINKVLIKEDSSWREKLWNMIVLNYSKTKYFKIYAQDVKPHILTPVNNLAIQNINFIKVICDILNINTNFEYSSKLNVSGSRSIKNKALLESVNAKVYLSASGSFDYMYEDGIFPLDNIECLFQNAELESYPQHSNSGEFIPYLSILDALFNVGADETLRLVNNTTKHWKTWQEMVSEYDHINARGGGIDLGLKSRDRHDKHLTYNYSSNMFGEAA